MIDAQTVRRVLSYDEKTGAFTWLVRTGSSIAGSRAGQISSWGYLRIPINGKKHTAHKIAWLLVYGEWPRLQIDHIDGNKLNNAIANLRLATPSLNQLYNNRPRSNNKSGLVGVSPMRDKFKAQLKVNGAARYLGTFDTKEEAHSAYMAAKQQAIARAHGITGDKHE